MADAEASVDKAASGLGHKLGPLPVWAWIVIGVGGAAGIYFLIQRAQGGGGAGGPGAFANMPGTPNPFDTGLTTTPSSGTSTTTTVTPASQAQISAAIAQFAANLSIPLNVATDYWNSYISGNAPIGLGSQAQGNYNSFINAVLTSLGSGAPTPIYVAPSNTNWLAEALGQLPTTPFEGESAASIQAGITNLFSGISTTLTQAEADWLVQTQQLIGSAPSVPGFTIGTSSSTGGTGGGGTGGTTTPTVSANDITNWQNLFFAGVATFTNWVTDAPAAVQSGLNATQQLNLYNYFNSATQVGGALHGASAATIASVVNGFLANPNSIPLVPAAPTTSGTATNGTPSSNPGQVIKNY